MSPADLKKRFLKCLEERLKQLGLVLVRDSFNGLSFIRDSGDIRHFFDFSATKHGDAIEVTSFFVAVRFDAVERKVAAYQDHLPFVTEKDLAWRRTLGTRLGPSADGFWQKKWRIRDEPTLLKAVNGVEDLFRTTGIPFLDKYSRIEEAMKILADDSLEARRLVGPDDKRAEEAIAMALLTEGLAAAVEMKAKKLAFLMSSNRERYLEVSRWADRLFAAEHNESW